LVLAGRAILAGIRCDSPAVVRGLADEALAAAEATGDARLVVAALHGVFRSALELGDLSGLQRAAARLSSVATASLFPFAVVRVGLLDNSLRLARGNLIGLEDRLASVEATGAAIGAVSSATTVQSQRGLLALERAQFDALTVVASALAPDSTAWRALHALALAETGRTVEARFVARAALAFETGEGGGELTEDERGIAAVLAAEVAVLAADVDLARCTRTRLFEKRGRFAVVAHATVTLGPVDRLLGLLALVDGDAETAVTELRRAVALAEQAPLWRTRSELGLAIALRARGGPGDACEAARLLDGVRSSSVADPARGGSAWLAVQFRRAVASPLSHSTCA
jgi:hypothetical protein